MTAEEILNLGVMYYNGAFVKQDLDKAFDYFQEAEALGSQEVFRYLGFCYYSGQGTAENDELSFEYLRKALEFNPKDAESIWHLAECYYFSYGVKKNNKKYFELNLQAAELGYQKSFKEISLCYYKGCHYKNFEVKIDLNKALSWAEKYGDPEWINMIKRDLGA